MDATLTPYNTLVKLKINNGKNQKLDEKDIFQLNFSNNETSKRLIKEFDNI
jgi:hypothetical protein